MRKVQCGECGKRYDFDMDDFCPKCGAFNQPAKSKRIGLDGSVVRVDGINERNHQGSFVHRELHEENFERRRVGLAQSTPRTARPVEQSAYQKARKKSKMPLIGWIVLAIIAINLFSSLVSFLFLR